MNQVFIGYDQQQEQPIHINMELPDKIHTHQLLLEPSSDSCTICSCKDEIIQKRELSPSYVCHKCNIIICFDCGKRILYGGKMRQIHEHRLLLQNWKGFWGCDLCHAEIAYSEYSFFCVYCNYNICLNCFTKNF